MAVDFVVPHISKVIHEFFSPNWLLQSPGIRYVFPRQRLQPWQGQTGAFCTSYGLLINSSNYKIYNHVSLDWTMDWTMAWTVDWTELHRSVVCI